MERVEKGAGGREKGEGKMGGESGGRDGVEIELDPILYR